MEFCSNKTLDYIFNILYLNVSNIRFVLEFGYSKPPCGTPKDDPSQPPEWWHMIIGNIHYLHFGFILFLISAAVAIFISLITPPIGEEHLYRLTFWSRHSTKIRVDLNEDAQYSNNEGKGK